jgi:aspartyl/asparaginyl-tRNA synthetase
MRISDMEELCAGYKREGIDATDYYWFTDQRKYGTCEHGGYGLGVEVRYPTFFCVLLGLSEEVHFPAVPRLARGQIYSKGLFFVP